MIDDASNKENKMDSQQSLALMANKGVVQSGIGEPPL